ncbi:Uncharacterised protein [Mycobacteroides abscessus subsp. abscessus]|nr:Uncharacterised protein [Mycobacteroides abscessus subsp. abscessus]
MTVQHRVWVVAKHQGWGNSITLGRVKPGAEHLRWTGWTSPLVRTGDVFEAELMSGEMGRFLVTNLERQYGVSDMWIATTPREPFEIEIPD